MVMARRPSVSDDLAALSEIIALSDASRDLIEALGVAVYTTDAAGRITFFNEAAAELWGRRPELGKDEWCGSWRLYWLDGRLMQHDECPMAITLRENRPVRGAEAVAERPDGTRVAFMPFPTPLRDASGALIGAVNVLVDITERKRAEAEANRQRELTKAITENMSVGLVMVDLKGRIEFMNPAAEKITGYSFEGVHGKPAHDNFHRLRSDGSHFPRNQCPIDQANVSVREVIGHEDVFVRPDGSFYHVVCNIAPLIRDGHRIGAIVDLRDTTQAKKAEEAMKQSLALKDQFLGLVSHELRTPIATIVGNAIVLLRRGDTLPPETQHQAMLDVASESQKLQRIIENLLLITRVDSGEHLEPEPVRLEPLIAEAVTSFQRRNPKRSVSIVADGDVPITLGHASTLPLVFDNLISNADKYSPLESPIEIIISAGDSDDILICIRDQGIGLAENETEEVFIPFYRSVRARSQASGIGLGLAVCKRIIEAQGGRIWAVARPEGGCDFVISLQQALEQ